MRERNKTEREKRIAEWLYKKRTSGRTFRVYRPTSFWLSGRGSSYEEEEAPNENLSQCSRVATWHNNSLIWVASDKLWHDRWSLIEFYAVHVRWLEIDEYCKEMGNNWVNLKWSAVIEYFPCWCDRETWVWRNSSRSTGSTSSMNPHTFNDAGTRGSSCSPPTNCNDPPYCSTD